MNHESSYKVLEWQKKIHCRMAGEVRTTRKSIFRQMVSISIPVARLRSRRQWAVSTNRIRRRSAEWLAARTERESSGGRCQPATTCGPHWPEASDGLTARPLTQAHTAVARTPMTTSKRAIYNNTRTWEHEKMCCKDVGGKQAFLKKFMTLA